MIQLTDGTYLMDSDKIAPKLEEIKPEPSLHLDLGLHQEVAKLMGPAVFPIFYLGDCQTRAIDRNISLLHNVSEHSWVAWLESERKGIAVGRDGKDLRSGVNVTGLNSMPYSGARRVG